MTSALVDPLTRPVFTVITANFNSGQKLASTIDSVLSQSVKLEYWIIDGGSSDESLACAVSAAKDNPGLVYLVSERDRGIYHAMNKGVRAARGRYVIFMGAGDILNPGVLAQVVPHLPAGETSFVYGDAWYDDRAYDGPFDEKKLYEKNICHQAIFYGREIFVVCGEFNERYRRFADWDLNLRCFGKRQIRRIYIPVIVSYFEGGGQSDNGDSAFATDRFAIARRALGLRFYLYLVLREAKWTFLTTLGLVKKDNQVVEPK